VNKIIAQDINVQFDQELIISGLSFVIQPGITRITSRTGGGKSLVLKLISGLLEPSSGKIYFDDLDMTDLGFEDWTKQRRHMGYSFDFGGLLNNRSLFENLVLPLHYHQIYDLDKAKEVVNEWLQKFDLFNCAHLRPSQVTGSQRKAVCVVRSMVMSPKVLLLDDPTTGLKNSVRKVLMNELKNRMSQGELTHVIFTSDDEDFVQEFQEKSQEIQLRDF
jgi:phospholipid/cholesterol/gamma-HCH transport system ATP-binding protein